MEKRNQYDELLMKYLLNEISETEEEFIVRWIGESEENKQYFKNLSKTWRLTAIRSLNKVNVDEKWNDFQQLINRTENSLPELNISEVVKEEDVAGGELNKGRTIRRIFTAVAVAACLVLLVGLGRQFFIKKQNIPTLATIEKNITNDSSNAVVRTEINNSRSTKKLLYCRMDL